MDTLIVVEGFTYGSTAYIIEYHSVGSVRWYCDPVVILTMRVLDNLLLLPYQCIYYDPEQYIDVCLSEGWQRVGDRKTHVVRSEVWWYRKILC